MRRPTVGLPHLSAVDPVVGSLWAPQIFSTYLKRLSAIPEIVVDSGAGRVFNAPCQFPPLLDRREQTPHIGVLATATHSGGSRAQAPVRTRATPRVPPILVLHSLVARRHIDRSLFPSISCAAAGADPRRALDSAPGLGPNPDPHDPAPRRQHRVRQSDTVVAGATQLGQHRWRPLGLELTGSERLHHVPDFQFHRAHAGRSGGWS